MAKVEMERVVRREPKILPYDEFCLKFFTTIAGVSIQTIANADSHNPGGGLLGLVKKCYRGYVQCIEEGWDEFGE